jgi:hypothetical protein
MSRVKSLGQFIWDFVVGDDWRIAAGVVAALGVTALAANAGATAWWILPLTVIVLLAVSVWSVARSR